MNLGKTRALAHIQGESGVNIVRSHLPESWVVREYTPDYGIDLNVELCEPFGDNYITSGEHLFFQVKNKKSLEKTIIKIKPRVNVEKEYRYLEKEEVTQTEVVKFPLDTDELCMVEKMGSAVPVILAVVDDTAKDVFFVCLNDYIEKIIVPSHSEYYKQKSKTVYIPTKNLLNSEKGINILRWYAKRPKLYALFNKINYQNDELNYCCNDDLEKMTAHFLKILLRSDAWSAENYFYAMHDVKQKIDYYLKNGITQEAAKAIEEMSKTCDVDEEIWEGTYCIGETSFREIQKIQSLHQLWNSLNNMGNIFEDMIKEMFLPTYLAMCMEN